MRTGMAYIFLLSMLIASFASPLMAQEVYRIWDSPSLNGIAVRQGLQLEFYQSMASSQDGNLCVAWSDTRWGNRDVFAQLYDPEGNALWDENGIIVSDFYGRQEDLFVQAIGDNDWLITWVDYRNDIQSRDLGDIYAQRLNHDGERQWEHVDPDHAGDNWGGVPVCIAPGQQISVQLFPHEANGVMAVWVDGRNGFANIYSQVINDDGSMDFVENGIPVMSGNWNIGNIHGWGYAAVTDGTGGLIVAASDLRDPGNRNIYCQHIDAGGNLTWGEGEELISGIPLVDFQGSQSSPRICQDGQGGAFVIWQDDRNDINNDIYGQHISAEGNRSWNENGEVICDNPYVQIGTRIVSTGVNEAVLVWEDGRNDLSDLYMQKISNDNGLVLHWGTGTEAIVLSETPLVETGVQLTNFDNSVIVTFTAVDSHDPYRDVLYIQKIDQDGTRLWDNEGDLNNLILCDKQGLQENNVACQMNAERLGVVYSDGRRGSRSLYLQLYNPDGSPQLIPEENGELIIEGLDGNAFVPEAGALSVDNNFVTIGWIDQRHLPFASNIYFQKVNLDNGSMNYDGFATNGINVTPGFPFGEIDTVLNRMDALSIKGDNQFSYLAWEDRRNIFCNKIAVQKIDSDGTLIWGEANHQGIKDRALMIADSDNFHAQYRPQVIPDGNGGMFVLFLEENDDFYQNLRIQKISSGGDLIWTDDGIWITDNEIDYILDDYELFDNGDLFFTYCYQFQHNPSGIDLYCQRINGETGETVWDHEVLISGAAEQQRSSRVIKIDAGMVVVWEDTRRVSPTVDIYGQLVLEDGGLAWNDENGHLLIAEENGQKGVSLDASDRNASDFWLAWEDSRNDNNKDIYVQKFYDSGQPVFNPANGIQVTDLDQDQESPDISVLQNNTAFIVWEADQENGFKDLAYSYINYMGEIYEPYLDDGEILCDADYYQRYCSTLKDNQGGLITVWEDLRSTDVENHFNIYAQRLLMFNDVKNPDSAILPQNYSLNQAYPNPFNPSTKISFNLRDLSDVKLTIYDVLGRTVRSLLNEPVRAGQHEVSWDGKDMQGQMVASGKYFYRLEVDGKQISRSLILLK